MCFWLLAYVSPPCSPNLCFLLLLFHMFVRSQGCGSDAEAEQVFKMESMQPPTQQNKGYIPPPLLRRKQGRNENGQGCASPLPRYSKCVGCCTQRIQLLLLTHLSTAAKGLSAVDFVIFFNIQFPS